MMPNLLTEWIENVDIEMDEKSAENDEMEWVSKIERRSEEDREKKTTIN